MAVPVVEVGHMRMTVHQRRMRVLVQVATKQRIIVLVMAVVPGVLVFVFDRIVRMRVFVAASKDECDAAAGDE